MEQPWVPVCVPSQPVQMQVDLGGGAALVTEQKDPEECPGRSDVQTGLGLLGLGPTADLDFRVQLPRSQGPVLAADN